MIGSRDDQHMAIVPTHFKQSQDQRGRKRESHTVWNRLLASVCASLGGIKTNEDVEIFSKRYKFAIITWVWGKMGADSICPNEVADAVLSPAHRW